MLQSKAEREAKEYVAAIKARHEEELAALQAEMETLVTELGVRDALCFVVCCTSCSVLTSCDSCSTGIR